MLAKHLRAVMTLVYLASSILPLNAQQSPNQPQPNIPSQTSPGPNESPTVPRRLPVVPPQSGGTSPEAGSPVTPQVPAGSPIPPGGTSQAAPTPQQTPIPIPPERRLLPPPTVPSGSGMVSLNFNRADLVEIIHILAQHLRLTYTIDPEVKGIVTIHSAEPLRAEDLLPIFHQVLRMNGAVAVRTGNVYRITPIKDGKGLARPVGQNKEDSFAIQVLPVRFFAVAEMKKILTPFLMPGGELIEYPRGNFLMVIDLPSNIQRLAEIVDLIDVQVFAGTRMEIYQPRVASAEELAAEMTKVMQSYGASAPQTENFAAEFIALPRINQLLIISHSEAAWAYAKRWLERIDVVAEGPGRRIFIYPVENGKAADLADVLNQALGQAVTGTRSNPNTLQNLHRSTTGGTTQSTTFGTSTSTFGSPSQMNQQLNQQRLPSAFATVPVPGQAPIPVQPQTQGVPTPTAPGTPRPPAGAPGTTAKPDEQLRVVADPGTNSLIIYGTVQEFQNIKNILKDLDAVPRQVLLNVLVAEVTLSDNQSLGVDYEVLRRNPASIFGQRFGSAGAVRTLGEAFPSGGVFGNGVSGVFGGRDIKAIVNALQSDTRFKVLSSPTILATDNRPARIQVGTEEPIATGTISQAVGGVANSTSIQYRNTGRIVTIIPQVNSQGLVNLQILAEVSQRRNDPVTVGQDSFPAFDTRQAETSAVVQDGETLAIGGIITDSKSRTRSGIPYLMDLPVFGRFFSTTSDEVDRTELIMLISPNVIRNRVESRTVTEDFKNKLSTLRNELEKFRREQEKLKPKYKQPSGPVLPDSSNTPEAPQDPGTTPPPPTGGPGAAMAPLPLPGSSSESRVVSHRVNENVNRIAGETREKTNRTVVSLSNAASRSPTLALSNVKGTLTNRSIKQPQAVRSNTDGQLVPAQNQTDLDVSSAKAGSGDDIAFAALVRPLEVYPDQAIAQLSDPLSAQAPSRQKVTLSVDRSAKSSQQQPSPSYPPVAQKSPGLTQFDNPAQINNGNRIWAVQVASFPQKKDAEELVGKLRAKGYDAYVFTTDLINGLRFRVRVGRLTSRDQVMELQKTLKLTEHFNDSYIEVALR